MRGVLRPGNDRARAHDGGQVALHEGSPRQIGQRHHLVDSLAALLGVVMRHLGQHDRRLGVVTQIVQRRDQGPAVHLALVDLLGAMVEAGRVAQAHRVGGGEQAEIGVRRDDLVLVQKRQLAVGLQHALDHEHHVRAARVVFVKDDRGRVPQRPRQDALVEHGDLLAVDQLDRVLANQVDPADMAVQVHAHAGPVQARRDLFDMGGLARPVIALDHDAAVVGKACQDRHRRVGIELVGAVDLGDAIRAVGKALDLHVAVQTEHLAQVDLFGGFRVHVQHRP